MKGHAMRPKFRQQMLLAFSLIVVLVFVIGITIGVLIGQMRWGSGTASNLAGLGISRQAMIDHLAAKGSSEFRFKLESAADYDFYYGESAEVASVKLSLNGPPDDLQQIAVAFSLKNIGQRTQCINVLKAIAVELKPSFDVNRVMSWLDKAMITVIDSKLWGTTVVGQYRFILRPSPPAPGSDETDRAILTIEPAVVVRWTAA
jgi:hypothetical protein